eukprot:CAMPEP_0116006852 /NCGR_PEP_ID=MMETSP0321-20121206/1967_1 /TAXON_ID=163516 /ORGANISM="Leptocylindrus danicus var. danicus, Strain B650" /LENGTH=1485 /DNA_ID=CAMNT_0003475469 /DNA_START=138 /DNA_END=4596 /DNA_ORIENTATION=+
MDNESTTQILQAIAISNGTAQQTDHHIRVSAYHALEDFKQISANIDPRIVQEKIRLCLDILLSPQSQTVINGASRDNQNAIDVTASAKMFVLLVLKKYVQVHYKNLSSQDCQTLRNTVLESARLTVSLLNAASDDVKKSVIIQISWIKEAEVLSDLAARDFPQRWPTFLDDLYGKVWGLSEGNDMGHGARICMECLSLLTEDCTDSDFNSKISTTRRNDILQGLNEIKPQLLSPIFAFLSQQYSILCTCKNTIREMESFLAREGRQPTPLEREQYNFEGKKREHSARLVESTVATLEKFCLYMPLDWMFTQNAEYDFVSVFLYLLRENTLSIQVLAVTCLDALSQRKLEPSDWFRLVSSIPASVSEANQAAQEVSEGKDGVQLLEEQLPFHLALSKMLANLLLCHIAHVTTDKYILKGDGEKYSTFSAYLSLLTQLLSHPSAAICGEQINLWSAFLRDPQLPKSGILSQYINDVLAAYMRHIVRLRWSDIEEGIHPMADLFYASWDDKEEYDTWLGELRSKATGLIRSIAHCEPEIAASFITRKMLYLLEHHGNGEPRDHLDEKTNRLTSLSESVIQFEGITAPFEYILQGLPPWTAKQGNTNDRRSAQICTSVQASLSQLATSIVSWNPAEVYLKLRRASLLGSLKYIWVYDSTTLPAGVDALLCYLTVEDEWASAPSSSLGVGEETLSTEVISLRKKSGTCLVAVSKKVPKLLLPWLAQLSERARQILASDTLLPPNRMHLFEFLSCVASAVEDSNARSSFVADVLSQSFEVLESNDAKDALGSEEKFLKSLGVLEAGIDPGSVTNAQHVRTITNNFTKLYSAFNQLLSVGRRCHESAMRRPNGGIPLQGVSLDKNFVPEENGSCDVKSENFPDEGTVSIFDLAADDPFVPLWPRIIPPLLQALERVLRLWHPEYQARLLSNKIQRFVYAISDDEVFLAMKQDSLSSGGVFGQGGTAGTVVSGWDRRSLNLVPRWSGWIQELRHVCFQLLGLMAVQRVLFAPEVASMVPTLVSVVSNQNNLMSMEHRHIVQYLKQFIEPLLTHCPKTLYTSHLAPIISPALVHVQARLSCSWEPILTASVDSTTALSSSSCEYAVPLASKGGEEWFKSYYARGGLFVGDAGSVIGESTVEKFRVDLTRTYCDMVQCALALRGDWALVLANIAKEEQATKKKDPSRLTTKPKSRIGLDSGVLRVNANGTPRSSNQDALEARQLARINALARFLLLEDSTIAGSLVPCVIQCLGYPDAYSARRCTRLCHRILEVVASYTQYADLIGRQMFSVLVKAIVTEPKWMVGMEWDMIAVIRDIYCRLALGQWLLPCGQGAAMQQARNSNDGQLFEQTKYVDKPLQGGGILCSGSDLPRQILAGLPGIGPDIVRDLDMLMVQKTAAKHQKDGLRDLLRAAAENVKQMEEIDSNNQEKSGLFGRANLEESVLNEKLRSALVPSIPEKLITKSQLLKSEAKLHQQSSSSLVGDSSIGALFGEY